MPAPTTTLLIEGSFSELAEEFANYIDSLRKEGSLQSEIAPLLQPIREQEQSEGEPDQKQYDEVLKKIVGAATALNGAPEKGEWETSGQLWWPDQEKRPSVEYHQAALLQNSGNMKKWRKKEMLTCLELRRDHSLLQLARSPRAPVFRP